MNDEQAAAVLAATLRAEGLTWVDIVARMQQRFDLPAVTAFRLAHSWTQAQAAAEWNRRWPDDSKSARNFGFWEAYPGPDGYPPSRHVLRRLAELYACSVADLVTSDGDFRHLDEAPWPRQTDTGHRSTIRTTRSP